MRARGIIIYCFIRVSDKFNAYLELWNLSSYFFTQPLQQSLQFWWLLSVAREILKRTHPVQTQLTQIRKLAACLVQLHRGHVQPCGAHLPCPLNLADDMLALRWKCCPHQQPKQGRVQLRWWWVLLVPQHSSRNPTTQALRMLLSQFHLYPG